MKVSIAREEDYRRDVREYFDSILNGRLMSIDINCREDSELPGLICEYNPNSISNIDNYCAWVTIGEISEEEYYGKRFKFVKFYSGRDLVFTINFSQFIYSMSISNKNILNFGAFDPLEAKYCCTVDGNVINPDTYFTQNIGKKLMLLFSMPAVTSFNKEKDCYFFLTEQKALSNLRKYILKSKIDVLDYYLKYPAAYAPSTTIMFESSPGSIPFFNHNVTTQLTVDFVIDVFNNEFRTIFEKKLEEIKTYRKI